MTAKRKVHYSVVQFRRQPNADGAGAVNLGFIIGFETKQCAAVGLAVRASLDEKMLAELDPLSREVLENRLDVLVAEVDAALNGHHKPKDVLRALAAQNPWTLCVTPPQEAEVSVAADFDNASVQKVAEDYVLRLYSRNVLEAQHTGPAVAAPAPRRVVPTHGLGSEIPALPAPWMIPPVVRMLPRAA